MIIDCISDLHGFYPELEGGDLLIIAGDLTAQHTLKELDQFNEWACVQDYKKKIVIAGNHDNFFEKGVYNPYDVDTHKSECVIIEPSCDYLCDSGIEFEGLKIWGSPWTAWFNGINPNCKSFTKCKDSDLAKKWDLIPDDTDILVTHSPPFCFFDRTERGEFVGSVSLKSRLSTLNLKLHVFGHIHECGGKIMDCRKVSQTLVSYFGVTETIFVNASYVNEKYEPVNKPIRVIL